MTKKSKASAGAMHRCTITKGGKFPIWRIFHDTCESASEELARMAGSGYTIESRERLVVGSHSPRAKCVECGGVLDSALAKKELDKQAKAFEIAERRMKLWAEMKRGETSPKSADSSPPPPEQQTTPPTETDGERRDCSGVGRFAGKRKSGKTAAAAPAKSKVKKKNKSADPALKNWQPEKVSARRAAAPRAMKPRSKSAPVRESASRKAAGKVVEV